MTKITFMEALKRKLEGKCLECGFERKEHAYNGACYGICGEFVQAPPILEIDFFTMEALSRQAIEQHERVRILEEWVQETIDAWKRRDIKTAHIQRGQFLLEP